MLSSNEQILHEAMRDADRIKESVGQREVPAVDEVLVAPTVVGEQLYGLVADERSIADAMFLLSRALDKGRIEGDVFVKVSCATCGVECVILILIFFLFPRVAANQESSPRAVHEEGARQEDRQGHGSGDLNSRGGGALENMKMGYLRFSFLSGGPIVSRPKGRA